MVSVFVDDGTGGKSGKLTRGEFVNEAGSRVFVGNGRMIMVRKPPTPSTFAAPSFGWTADSSLSPQGRGQMFSGGSGIAIEMARPDD
jgi:hypothetical protein